MLISFNRVIIWIQCTNVEISVEWLQLRANENPKDQFNQMNWSHSELLLHKLLHQCSMTWRRSSESGFIRYFSFSLYAGTLIYQIKCRNFFWKQVVSYTHFFLPLNFFLSMCLNIALCEQKNYLDSIIFLAFPPYQVSSFPWLLTKIIILLLEEV